MRDMLKFKWMYNPLALMSMLTFWGGDPPQAQSNTTVTQNYSPEEAARRAALMGTAESTYNAQKGGYASVVQPSAATTQAQNMALNTASGPGTTLANNNLNALNFGLSGAALDPNNAPGYSGALDSSLRRVDHAYTDPGGVLSQIRGGFTGGNSGGTGTREGIAGGIAGREYLNTVGDVSSKMALDQYGKGLDFMKSSMAMAPSGYNLMMQPSMTTGAVGSQQEAYKQAQYNAPWAELQPYANMVQGFSNPSTTTSGRAPVSSVDPTMQMLGSAAMMMALMA